MTTRKERLEERERRAEMKRRYPACFWCKKPCVAGQVDALGRPAHYLCQIACHLHRRFRDKAHVNPGLPQVQETSIGSTFRLSARRLPPPSPESPP